MGMLDDISGDDITETVENTADQNDRTDGGGVDADDIGVEKYKKRAEDGIHRIAGDFGNAVRNLFTE